MSRVASKILRILLVFSLTFMFTWHLEYSFAYGAEPTDENAAGDTGTPPEGEGGAASSSDTPPPDDPAPGDPAPDDPGPGTDPDPGDNPGENPNPNPDPSSSEDVPDTPPASYAYIKSIEILKAEGTWDPDKNEKETFGNNEVLTIKNDKDKEAKYEFRLRIVYVPDSNSAETKEVTLTPKTNLSTLTEGKLSDEDIKWKIYTTTEGSTEEHAVPKEQAHIDEKTGVLTIKAGLSIHVSAYSDKGVYGSAHVSNKIDVVSTDSESEDSSSSSSSSDPAAPVAAVIITYDLNGVEGSLAPTNSDENGNAVVANIPEGVEAPEGKTFGGWNTQADGKGSSFAPGASVNAATIADVQAAAAAAAESTGDETPSEGEGSENDGEGTNPTESMAPSSAESSSPGEASSHAGEASSSEAATGPLSLTLYAQWVEPSSDDTGSGLVRISYIPAPLKDPPLNAFLTPILADVGHITFYYEWEVSTDGGASWEYTPNENIQVMQVPTTEKTIGWQYRVNVRILDSSFKDDDGNIVDTFTSEPVTIRAAGEDEFLAVLEYEPTWEGTDTMFTVQLLNKQESAVTYEWYVSPDYGRTWTTIADAHDSSYKVPTDESTMGNWYRVKVRTNGAGSSNTCDGDECDCDPNVACTNIQMLVALSDADPSEFEPSEGSSSSGVPGGEGSGDSSSSSSGDSSSSGSGEPGPSEQGGSSEAGDSSSSESGAAPSQENTQPPSQQPPSSPTPAPQNTPTQPSQLVPIDSITKADEATPAPEAPGLNIQVDPEVTEKINEEVAAQEEKTTGQLGQRWRKLSVIPQQEEIKEVLADNPFAPFVLPLTVALVACGMVERLVFFRRQKQDSGAAFA